MGDHIRAATPLMMALFLMLGFLGFVLLAGGVFVAIIDRDTITTFNLFGAQLTSTDVGVTLAVAGVVLIVVVIRRALTTIDHLGSLPKSR